MAGCLRVRASNVTESVLWRVSSHRYLVFVSAISSALIIKCKIYE